jgi:glycosyltransferase involved in cell wall biosynthesis
MTHPENRQSEYESYFVPHVDFKSKHMNFIHKFLSAKRFVYYQYSKNKVELLVRRFQPDLAHIRNIYHHISPAFLWKLKELSIPIIYHLNDFKLLCPNYNLFSKDAVCEICGPGQFWRLIAEQCHSQSFRANLVLCTEAYVHKWLGTYERCVDRFIAPSFFCKDKLVEYGWPEERISVLHHFQRIPKDSCSRNHDDYILYFGRISPEKGLTTLIDAMRGLPRIRLIIAGSGPQKKHLENLVIRQELRNVFFTGHVSGKDLNNLIKGSRFIVMPSLVYETFGKVILESYAHGRPVIATSIGSRPELVKNRETGLLFEPSNIEELREKIAYLYYRPQLALKMGKAGKAKVEEEHSPETHYSRLLEIYNSVFCSQSIS